MLCGMASGYSSFVNGRDIYFIEDRCRGRGDAACHVVGQSIEEWGERIGPHMAFFQRACVEGELKRLTEKVKEAERRLRARRQALARATGEEVDPSGIIARSEAMRRVLDRARRVAKVDSTVLLT